MDHASYERLKRLEYEYRILSENALECIWVYDIQSGGFTYMSPNVLTLRGITADDALKESLEDAVPQDTYSAAMDNTKVLVSRYLSGERRQEMLTTVADMQLKTKDHGVRQIEVTVKLIENQETGALEILGVTRDITERKTMEDQLNKALASKSEMIERLKESEESLKRLAEKLNQKNRALSEIASRDALTGICNRYYFDKKVIEETESSRRYAYPLSMILFDIDSFKKVNDTWGHDTGDRILEHIAGAAKKSIRKRDVLARWGGEEFVVLMPNTALPAAIKAAEKLRKKLDSLSHPGIDSKVTASFGVSAFMYGERRESWFKRVDYAMFCSKKRGRNLVTGLNWVEAFPSVWPNLVWEDEWENGNSRIDRQHKEIILFGNRAIDAAVGKESEDPLEATRKLLERVRFHFDEEEAILRDIAYPEADKHAAIHHELWARMNALYDQFLSGGLRFTDYFSFMLDKFFIGHMLKDDFLYFPYLKKHRAG